jgi:hypothetical protein
MLANLTADRRLVVADQLRAHELGAYETLFFG